MKKKIHNVIEGYLKKISKYTAAVPVNFSSTSIHKLRTTYKKIRALLRWQKSKPGTYRSFKGLYQLAGQARNLQVAKKLLKKRKGIPSAMYAWMNKLTVKVNKEWTEPGHQKRLESFIKNVRRTHIKPVTNKKFFSKNLYAVDLLLYIDPIPDESLHDIRKKLKDLQYVLDVAGDETHKGPLRNIRVAGLKESTAAIGTYNDLRVSLELLTTYAAQEKNQTNINKANKTIDRLINQKASRKEKLIHTLRKTNWLALKL